MEPTAHQPIATLVARSISAFPTTWCKRSEPSHMDITWTVQPRELLSAISSAKSLLVLNMNVDLNHSSLASGRPQDSVTSQKLSVGIPQYTTVYGEAHA